MAHEFICTHPSQAFRAPVYTFWATKRGLLNIELVSGANHGNLWSRSAVNAGDVVAAEDDDGDSVDGVGTSLPVLCGRNSGDGWIFSYSLQGKDNERGSRGQPREIDDPGNHGGWAIRTHPRTNVERPRTWKWLGSRSREAGVAGGARCSNDPLTPHRRGRTDSVPENHGQKLSTSGDSIRAERHVDGNW